MAANRLLYPDDHLRISEISASRRNGMFASVGPVILLIGEDGNRGIALPEGTRSLHS